MKFQLIAEGEQTRDMVKKMRLKKILSERKKNKKVYSNQNSNKEDDTDLSKANPTENSSSENETVSSLQKDIAELRPSTLSDKYKLTYSSWRNMKQRCKSHGLELDPQYEQFKSFLQLLGPRPARDYTLDRTDNSQGYIHGNCAWKDKKSQANNRSSTKHLTYKGECLPLTTWATRTGQKADTLRSRKRNGWSDEETIRGTRTFKLGRGKPAFKREPIPWRGSEKEIVHMEQWYRRFGYSFGNRYEAYIKWHEFQCKHMNQQINRFDEWGDSSLTEEDIHYYEKLIPKYRRRIRILHAEIKQWKEWLIEEDNREAYEEVRRFLLKTMK